MQKGGKDLGVDLSVKVEFQTKYGLCSVKSRGNELENYFMFKSNNILDLEIH